MSLVSFLRANNSEYDSIKDTIVKSLNLINFNNERDVDKIVIKPNMCYYHHPSTGEVTDPRFVSILIDVLRENFKDPDIFVVESDASAMKCKYAFKILGYDKMAEEKNVKLMNLSEEKSKSIEHDVNGSHFKFLVPEIFYESDLVVNVPKIKYINHVKMTCALKNMFGCNAYSRKYIYHKFLNETIVIMNKLIKTNLVVVDGLIVCGKNTKRLNLVMSSKDPVAIDAAASRLLGLNPKSVRQIVLASREDLGNLEFTPVGNFQDFKETFPKKTMKDNVREILASIYLRVF